MSKNTAEVQRIHVGGRNFVVVPEQEYLRLVGSVPVEKIDAVAYARASISRDLRRKRESAGLTQAVGAARAGIRLETLSRLENGRGNPTVSTVRRLLRALGEKG